MNAVRFSKATLLALLHGRAARIAEEQKFDRYNGTAQLRKDDIDRAVQYGRMKAMEEIADSIREGFWSDWLDIARGSKKGVKQ